MFTSKRLLKTISMFAKKRFSPIYDSGSCLCREQSDDKIEELLKDQKKIEKYIDNGVSEIHWEGIKLNHFDLIKQIKKEHFTLVISEIKRVEQMYNIDVLSKIINNIDSTLPANLQHHKLPDNRKQVIIKIIDLRIKRLIEIIK